MALKKTGQNKATKKAAPVKTKTGTKPTKATKTVAKSKSKSK